MPHLFRLPARYAIFGIAAVIGTTQAAMAGDDKRSLRVPLLLQYQQECAACHTAYPPSMLPAASWQRVMNNLPRHYGTDASLDPATVKQITTWLGANAGSYERAREQPPENRITRSAWFIREHDEVSAATWKLPAVKSAANCAACHTRSEQGDFNEHNVRIPR